MGGQHQHTDGVAQEIVEAWRPEERPMATIVLNHEQPHQECRCRHGQQQRYPVGVAHGEGHRSPERRQGDDGGQKLKHAAPVIRRGVSINDARQAASSNGRRRAGGARIFGRDDGESLFFGASLDTWQNFVAKSCRTRNIPYGKFAALCRTGAP